MKFTEFSLCRQGKFSWNRKHFGIDANGLVVNGGADFLEVSCPPRWTRQARAERQITISLRLGAFARKKYIAPLEQKDYLECVFY